jgi:ribosomal protein L12E/L44/L45/RPP1/RPP2
MDVDPMDAVEDKDDDKAAQEKHRSRLNSYVAVTVALLATFMGICHVKDDNIVQAMQQAQADKIDNYSWYQARNVREEVNRTEAIQLRAEKAAAPPQAQAAFVQAIAACEKSEQEQKTKKQEPQAAAEKADKDYDLFNVHDDQFDLSDALAALAVSLLAVTALTQKRWLFGIAMVPTLLGIFYGIAGLLELNGPLFHPDAIMKLLS